MTIFPTYIQILAEGYSESFAGNYIRSDFERGVAKQRKIACMPLKQVTFSAFICDEMREQFLNFFQNEGRDWFEFTDPSTNPASKKKARIIAGDLLMNPVGSDFDYWSFSLTLEMYA